MSPLQRIKVLTILILEFQYCCCETLVHISFQSSNLSFFLLKNKENKKGIFYDIVINFTTFNAYQSLICLLVICSYALHAQADQKSIRMLSLDRL